MMYDQLLLKILIHPADAVVVQEEGVGARRNHHLAVRLNRKKYMKEIARPAAILLKKEEKAQEPVVVVKQFILYMSHPELI